MILPISYVSTQILFFESIEHNANVLAGYMHGKYNYTLIEQSL